MLQDAPKKKKKKEKDFKAECSSVCQSDMRMMMIKEEFGNESVVILIVLLYFGLLFMPYFFL